ncbi:helix-turn-helix transcriptional regulator [Nocardia asteroides]|uniref:helix-turn-helix transcriptional regulator n=1 Tax=Nocardia asteroides TaxID=1824 RepID=UPI003415BED0
MTTKHTADRKTPTVDEFATAAEVAERWRTTERALSQQRYSGTGPAFVKIGRRVRYRWADVLEFESRHQRTA